MEPHLQQVAHNHDFHDHLERHCEEKFYDWRVTVLFYIAIHCLKALAASKKPPINIGKTHFEIEKNVNPEKRKQATPGMAMTIKTTAWKEYSMLQNYSREARYDGIENPEEFEQDRKGDYKECLSHLRRFKKYIRGQGVPLPNTTMELA